VGDNVGDCAGRGADIFESIAAENIGAMVLAASLAAAAGVAFAGGSEGVVLFPMVVAAFGLVGSFLGVLAVRGKDGSNPMDALNLGLYVTMAVAAIGFSGACRWLLHDNSHPDAWLWFTACGMVGLATSMVFVWITQYYTEYRYRPVKSIADASLSGPATNVINGLAVGMESTGLAVITICIAILTSYSLGAWALPGIEGAGLFGTAVATMGMLSTAGFILAMDNFGPITDNAGGIAEMSEQPKHVRERTDLLDSVGNTTKAVTKGYAIGSASLAAFLLFSAYIDEVNHYGTALEAVNVADPLVFVGALIGACLVFVFASLALRAVSNAAQAVIGEVRRQFREKPGILAGTEKPSYRDCVDIVTQAALREMRLPGVLVVATPILTGLIFKYAGTGRAPEVVAGMLIVGTITGILMALFLNNAGGAWDNAKKYIETGVHGGKRSDAHKAAVVGDTVGDPFKDTAGPSIHVLIKLLATVSLVLAPFFLA
jgi:K(+)-stimulated pyrophosphate-energized sodium pump